jgi:hypothetical protein
MGWARTSLRLHHGVGVALLQGQCGAAASRASNECGKQNIITQLLSGSYSSTLHTQHKSVENSACNMQRLAVSTPVLHLNHQAVTVV